VRALVLSNMLADAAHPERGRFVRDQVDALRALGAVSGGLDDVNVGSTDAGPADSGLQVELYEFAPGAQALARAARDLRMRYRGERFDVVHAHFGLTAWPALAVKARTRALTVHGTDVRHPRTRLATRAALPTVGLLAAVSEALLHELPGRRAQARALVLPCGVDMVRFTPIPRARARGALFSEPQHTGPGSRPSADPQRSSIHPALESYGADPHPPYLLFPADPSRAEKRFDRAQALAEAVGAQLLTLGGVEPERVPLYVNAAHAVLVPSEREGFGLAVLEALACDVPVLATPVGIHAQALTGLAGTLCEPFDLERWRRSLAPIVAQPDPHVEGRQRAEAFSATRMAERVAEAWRSLVAKAG
jgi:teichuronic acid biosynthesis glycosyltransferase TuaC